MMVETEEEMIKRKRQTEYALSRNEQALRGGNCKHEAFIYSGCYGIDLDNPVIALCNDDDSYYMQYFRSKQELDEFIDTLQKISEQLWGSNG